MKNIHLIATEKPSRLYKQTGALVLDKLSEVSNDGISINQNIYITSDEEIKEGDWFINKNGLISICVKALEEWLKTNKSELKKIILTTDPDLIKDGVQAIDNEFLEWFVENPSCAFVEVTKEPLIIKGEADYFNYDDGTKLNSNVGKYKIIIPQEPKQDWYCPKCQSYVSSESVTFEETHQICNTSVVIEESKQETLEEASLREYPLNYHTGQYNHNNVWKREIFSKGAKWHAERMYSEEDMRESFRQGHISAKAGSYNSITEQEDYNEWFEKFKKK
jgi:hypothetical protein